MLSMICQYKNDFDVITTYHLLLLLLLLLLIIIIIIIIIIIYSLSLSGDSFEDIDTFISGGDNGGSTLVVAIWGQQRFCFGLLRFWSVVYMGRGWFEGHKNWVDFGCQFPWFMDHCSGCWIDVEMVVVGWF